MITRAAVGCKPWLGGLFEKIEDTLDSLKPLTKVFRRRIAAMLHVDPHIVGFLNSRR